MFGCVYGVVVVRVELTAPFLAFRSAPNLSAVELPAAIEIEGSGLGTTWTDRCNRCRDSVFRRMLRSRPPFDFEVLQCYR